MSTVVSVLATFIAMGIIALALCYYSCPEKTRLIAETEQVDRDRKIEAHLRDNGYELFGIDFLGDDFEDRKAFLKLQNISYQTAVYNHSMIGYSDSSYKHSDPKDALWVRNLAAVEEAYKIYKEQLNKIRKDELHQQALKLLNN